MDLFVALLLMILATGAFWLAAVYIVGIIYIYEKLSRIELLTMYFDSQLILDIAFKWPVLLGEAYTYTLHGAALTAIKKRMGESSTTDPEGSQIGTQGVTDGS